MELLSDAEINCAARIAHHGFLSPVDDLSLFNVNLSSVPADHLASLASCVIGGVYIAYVSGCDLSPILDSLKCKTVEISGQSLNTEETQALMRAMEKGVEVLRVGVVDNRIWKNQTGTGRKRNSEQEAKAEKR